MTRVRDTTSPAPLEWGSLFVRWAQDHLRELFRAMYQAQEQSFIVKFSDETTAITTGTAKVTFSMPWAFRLYRVKLNLKTAQTSGSIFTVDINASGTSILSTKLTIDNTEKTSATAATSFVFASTDTLVDEDEEVSIDVDQVGDGTAKGGSITFYGVRT